VKIAAVTEAQAVARLGVLELQVLAFLVWVLMVVPERQVPAAAAVAALVKLAVAPVPLLVATVATA